MKVSFQADADLNEDIVSGLLRRAPEVDFQTAGEAGLRGSDDPTVLRRAADEGRILVTHDRKTMPKHFAELVSTQASPGLLIVSQQLDVRTVIEELLLVWSASEAAEWMNRVAKIPL